MPYTTLSRHPWPRGPISGLPAVVLAMLASGCSGDPRAAAVDPARAREALVQVLERWERGGRPTDLKSASPSITVQDFDWDAGARLVRFRVEGEGRDDDANLRIPVELTLRGPNGREVARRVTYVVGTSPSITVFREMF
jgi:hypothetical protein